MKQLFDENADSCLIYTEDGVEEARLENGRGEAGDIVVELAKDKDRTQVFVTAKESAVRYVRLRFHWLEPMDGNYLSGSWERTYGDVCFGPEMPHRVRPWYFFCASEEKLFACGVRVRPSAICSWQADRMGATLLMDVRCGGSGVLLSGRRLHAADIVSEGYPYADDEGLFLAQQAFCTRMCSDPILPPHPVYGANNWYYAYGFSSAEEILQDTDRLAELTRGLENRPYMVVDDCWEKNKRKDYCGGPWIPNEKFGDMELLAQKIREKGARPGIWFRPLWDRYTQLPEEARLSHTGMLDPTHPAVQEKLRGDVERIVRWGYELIKHDFSTFDICGRWGFEMNPMMTGDGWHFYDRSKTTAEAIGDLYRLIREISAPYGTLVLGCNTVGHLGAGLMHLNRIGDDTSGKLYDRSVIMGVNTLAYALPQHGTFFAVDADCLGIAGTIDWEDNRNWSELLAYSGTPVFFSMKPGTMTAEEKKELAGHLAICSRPQKTIVPLGLTKSCIPSRWKTKERELSFQWIPQKGLLPAFAVNPAWDMNLVKEFTENLWDGELPADMER